MVRELVVKMKVRVPATEVLGVQDGHLGPLHPFCQNLCCKKSKAELVKRRLLASLQAKNSGSSAG